MFNIGDKVVSPHGDIGIVISTDDNDCYPLAVDFAGITIHFTLNGSVSLIENQQDLHKVH